MAKLRSFSCHLHYNTFIEEAELLHRRNSIASLVLVMSGACCKGRDSSLCLFRCFLLSVGVRAIDELLQIR
jgi:hypothetical protein